MSLTGKHCLDGSGAISTEHVAWNTLVAAFLAEHVAWNAILWHNYPLKYLSSGRNGISVATGEAGESWVLSGYQNTVGLAYWGCNVSYRDTLP